MALSLPFCLKGNACQNAPVNGRHSFTCELMWDAQSEPWVFWRLKSLASMGDPEKQLKAIYLHVTTEKNWGVCCLMSIKMYCFGNFVFWCDKLYLTVPNHKRDLIFFVLYYLNHPVWVNDLRSRFFLALVALVRNTEKHKHNKMWEAKILRKGQDMNRE